MSDDTKRGAGFALPNRASFSHPDVPRFQTAWDSTSIGVAKKCPRKYQLSIIEGWASRRESHHLRYGILYHRAQEVYNHHIMQGDNHEAALRAALWDLRDGCTDLIEHDAGNGTVVEEKIWWNPGEFLSDKEAASNTKTLPNLFRTVIWYLDQFGIKDPAKTKKLANGKPAVEVSFRFDAGFDVLGHPILLSGHFDRLVEFNGQTYVSDLKTTKNTISGSSSYKFFAQFSPNNQMTLYTLASKIALEEDAHGVIVDAVQIAQSFSHFERGFANRTNGQLEEWLNDFQMLVQVFGQYAKQNYWPMNDTACSDYGGCQFREICNRDPSVREIFLASNYVRKFWDPLKIRGDI